MAQSRTTEHCVQMPAHGAGQGKTAAPTPEKQLNCFVRCIALIERLGNALGTLAFTWATVVLLGGYPTALSSKDFRYATAIVSLEAARMFSRNNRLDYQLLFRTRGAVRPLGWNGLTVIVCLSNAVLYLFMIRKTYGYGYQTLRHSTRDLEIFKAWALSMIIVPAALGQILSLGALKLLSKRLRRAISLCVPLVAIMLLAPAIPYYYEGVTVVGYTLRNTMAKWIVFLLLFLAVLVLTISRLRYPRITKLTEHALGSKQVFWRRLILNSCMFSVLVMLAFMHDDPVYRSVMIPYEVYTLVVVTFGNLQVPAAIIRIVLASLRLGSHSYYGDDGHLDKRNPGDKTNLVPSLNIFYGMVLGQGALYIAACMLDIFSFIPQRSLARQGGYAGKWGVECVKLYYAYAFEKYMEGGVVAPKKISLITFAMDSLNSDSSKNQFYGIRILHSLLQRDLTRTHLLSKLTTSTNTIARLINMLDWTSPRDITIRLFAAKVITELANSLRVVTVPGTMQVVSALLDYGNQQKRGNPLLDTDDKQEEIHDLILNANVIHGEIQDAVLDTSSLLEPQDRSLQQVHIDEQNNLILIWWQRISKFWSVPKEEPLTDQDLLPALGMSILDSLTSCDQDNCEEINKATGLISKIIGFTNYSRSDTMYTCAQWRVLVMSSLKLLHSLTSISGEIGITLRHKISKHPFLLRNLAYILVDNMSNTESRKLVAGILRNLAVHENARQAIRRIQVIISRLMHAFLTPEPSNADDDRLLRKISGQALTMLAMDSVNNCLTMLRETGYVFIKELTSIIRVDRYRCVAASLLRSMCLHAQQELEESDQRELSYALREVLERTLIADGAELEIFIGLSSQICKVIPEDLAKELEDSHIKQRFVMRLVDVLNSYTEPSPHCPGIRRVILEQAINMMEHDSRYTNCFIDRHMAEALSMVEETVSEAENYSLFLGDVGLMEAREPLSSLMARAKQLLAVR
ncbi:hypothetical protein SETIT_2G414100v2 [Setaria italica]|uniref:BLE2 protein n=2 Tax=Setaria italica TaxID=4555 RepID=K3ZZR1_SETIT|nr:hypothetical protein SETIT_2G414100v2 [Setaria italica]